MICALNRFVSSRCVPRGGVAVNLSNVTDRDRWEQAERRMKLELSAPLDLCERVGGLVGWWVGGLICQIGGLGCVAASLTVNQGGGWCFHNGHLASSQAVTFSSGQKWWLQLTTTWARAASMLLPHPTRDAVRVSQQRLRYSRIVS